MDIDDDESIQLPSPPRIRRQRRTQSEQLLMMEQPADSRARSHSMELFLVPYQSN